MNWNDWIRLVAFCVLSYSLSSLLIWAVEWVAKRRERDQ